jgi:hypothetical protein
MNASVMQIDQFYYEIRHRRLIHLATLSRSDK